MHKLLPCVGGFNDGKFIEPKGRDEIRMARPPATNLSLTHYESTVGFGFEIYTLTNMRIYGESFRFYVIEGMSLPEVVKKLIFGYKQYNKRKTLDLAKE